MLNPDDPRARRPQAQVTFTNPGFEGWTNYGRGRPGPDGTGPQATGDSRSKAGDKRGIRDFFSPDELMRALAAEVARRQQPMVRR